ncbi:hypothetical protein MBLNU230_g3876t1 [Neophaeotheca triangularis]
MEMPTYFLFRDIPPGEPFDPTSPPQFFPPKDSDELFDALRAKYPHVKTHSERMRDAIIEFLLEERDSELRAKTHSPAIPATTATTSPWQQSWPSMSSASEPSLFSSPDLFDLATPSFDASPSADMVPTLPARCPSEASPRALEDMTGVFSLSSAQQQPKQKTRRKMTEAEKVEYRKRRIVKACDKCSKRKRKRLQCHHNQPEMEGLPTKKAGKVTKPRTNAQKQPSPPSAFTSMSTSATPMTESLDETCDYGYVLGEPMADCDFDHFINFDDSTFGQQLYEPEFPETVPAAKSCAPTIAREGKPPLSSNRGIDSAPSPSSELSMLRRRIPRRQSLGANRHGTIGILDDTIWRAPADATLRNALSATLAQRQQHLATHHTTNNDTYERPDNSSSPSTAPPNLATRLDFSTRHDAAGRNASGASSNPTTSSQTTSHLYRAAQTPRRRPRPLDNQNPSHNNTLPPPNESKLSDHVRYRDHHGRDAHLQLLSEGTTSAGAKSTQPLEAWRFGLVALACFLAAGSSLVSALLAGLGLELVASSSSSMLRECWKFNRRGRIRAVEGLGKKMLLG